METILTTSEEAPDTIESLTKQLTEYQTERAAAEKEFTRLLGIQDDLDRAGHATDYTEADEAKKRRDQCDRIIGDLQNHLIPEAHQKVDVANQAESQEQIDSMLYRRNVAVREIEAHLDEIEQILINYRAINSDIPGHGMRKYHPFTKVTMTNKLHKVFHVRTRYRNPATLRKDDVTDSNY